MNFRRLIIILVIIILGFILTDTFLIRGPKKITKIIISPIVAPFNYLGEKTSGFFHFLKETKNLARENNDLKKEKNELAAENARLKGIVRQNEALQKENNLNQNLLAASVIVKSPTGFLKILTINKGTNDGVKINQAVISESNLIGKITEVEKKSAEVSLITNPNLLIPVTLEKSRGSGILRGSLSGIIVEDISNDTKIEINENIVTSGLGNEITANILVGKIEKIISRESEIFQKIIIASPIAFSRLETVFIVK